MNNQFIYHKLSYEELLHGSAHFAAHGMENHFLWAWIVQVLMEPEADYIRQNYQLRDDHEHIRKLLPAITRAMLAGLLTPPVHYHNAQDHLDKLERDRKVRELLEYNTLELVEGLDNLNTIRSYLAFPLLEAVLKRACMDYIDFSGVVLKYFSVPGGREYDPQNTKKNKCSSLKDLLWLYYGYVADKGTQDLLGRISTKIADRTNFGSRYSPLVSGTGFDIIYNWRNTLLHGTDKRFHIAATVFGVSLFVALNDVRRDYNRIRDAVIHYTGLDNMRADAHKFNQFYPPYYFYSK